MSNFIDRTGEVNKANNGLMMKVIACRRADDIDIEFEDGLIVYHKTYASFKRGSIRHPNIKNPNLVKCGFCTTNLTKKKPEYVKNKYVGVSKQMVNGMIATVIDYIDWCNITVQFNDGTIVTKKSMGNFLRGDIRNPNYMVSHINKKDIGVIKVSKCGFRVKLIGYTDSKTKCKVLFEDGVLKEMWYYGFLQGKIIHPGFNNAKGKCSSDKYLNFTDIIETFKAKGSTFYYCTDKDGVRQVMTPQKMMEKSGIKPVF